MAIGDMRTPVLNQPRLAWYQKRYHNRIAKRSESKKYIDAYYARGTSSPATAPVAFTAGLWTLSNPVTGGELLVTISTLPSNGGSAITALQYQIGAGAWTSLGGTTVGSYVISGLTDGVSVNVKIRAVNAVGNGSDSDVKAATPTAPALSARLAFNVAGNSQYLALLEDI